MVSDYSPRGDKHDLRVGRIWRRVAAFLIDVAVLGAVFATLRWVVLGSLPDAVIVVVPPGYFWLVTWAKGGRTIGKSVLGIEVVTTNLEEPSLGMIFLREVVGKFLLPLGARAISDGGPMTFKHVRPMRWA